MNGAGATLLVPGDTSGAVVSLARGLSFWGGVDPATGDIIDAHHPDKGVRLAGRVVLMPTSLGSCSGSGVLLQLARSGRAPAALVFREPEDTLTLGAVIATRLFDAPVAVLRLAPALYEALAGAGTASITEGALCFDGRTVRLEPVIGAGLELDSADRARLAGGEGPALQLAMEVLCLVATIQGARGFVDVSRAHIDGCILAHDANLAFAETMRGLGARTAVPTTINAISVDREHWQSQGVEADFGARASRLADAYVAMGALPTFTCAPYLLDDAPEAGELIGWSESNAVVYANSVLGARTVKHPDYLDLFIAMTGRAPATGVYEAEGRRPRCVIDVVVPDDHDDALWPLLGWLAGRRSPDRIPLLTGLEGAGATADDLKALCAAFGTTSAAPMLHIRGVTPEAGLAPAADAPRSRITAADLAEAWHALNHGGERIDLVAIGSPHASLAECRRLAARLAGSRCGSGTAAVVTLGRETLAAARAEGIVDRLEAAGVRVVADVCWCSITAPLLPDAAQVLMTNSGKYAHYAASLTGRGVRFGGLEDCVQAALTGRAAAGPPPWLASCA